MVQLFTYRPEIRLQKLRFRIIAKVTASVGDLFPLSRRLPVATVVWLSIVLKVKEWHPVFMTSRIDLLKTVYFCLFKRLHARWRRQCRQLFALFEKQDRRMLKTC